MRRLLAAIGIVASGAAALPAQSAPSGAAIRRLPPGDFPRLPVAVRRLLEQRDCRIPQPWNARSPQNVIHGAFTAARADEWAVLCSVAGKTQILVYRDSAAAARLADSLQASTDEAWIQDVGGGRMGYSRLIRLAPRRQIRARRADADGRAIPQPIDHDAIEQFFLDKAAETFYFARGRWYRRPTAD